MLRASNGDNLGSSGAFGAVASAAIAAGSTERVVYVPLSGKVRAFNVTTGEAIWEFPPNGSDIPANFTFSSPAIGADGTVYVGCTDKTGIPGVYAIGP